MINLLVTTAGGSGIYSVIEAVKESKYKDQIKLTLVDANEIAGALYEVDNSYIIPTVNNENFFCVLKKIIKKEKINFMLSLLDEELIFLADKINELALLGVKTLIPKKSSLLNSWNKINTFKICKNFMPKTYILEKDIDLDKVWKELNGEILLKPAMNRGGRGIIIPEDLEELKFFANKFLKKSIPYLIQKLIKGKEYNITSLHTDKGELVYAIARWKFEKRLIKSGSKASIIENNKDVVEFALNVLKRMDLCYGFNNVEVIESEDGIFLLEVNAGRIAAQDMNILKANVNFIDLFIDIMNNTPFKKPEVKYGVCNIKTSRDIWVEYHQIDKKLKEYNENIDSCSTSG